jgi:hypothetical protein
MPDMRDVLPFRTVPFRDLLWGVARRAGMIPEEDGIDRGAASLMAEAIQSAVYFGWTFSDWDEIYVTSPFAVTVSGNTRFVPRRRIDTWSSEGDRVAGYDMYTVSEVWDADPLAGGQPIKWQAQNGFLRLVDTAATEVWVRFAPPPPRCSSAVWSPTATYQRHDVVMDASGELWRCTAQSTVTGDEPGSSDRWEWQLIPEFFSEAVKAGGFALYTMTEGQFDTAAILSSAMISALESEVIRKAHTEGRYKTVY